MGVTVKQHTLANGLHIIGEVNPNNKTCGLGFFVNTGARDELVREAGISHFLEHMLFKGTKKRNALQITFDMGAVGAQSNAYTSEENTVYYSSVIPEYMPDIQDILSDMMKPALDPDEFDMEKNVILEEISLYLDRPHFYLFENASRDFFGSHPAGNSVLGTLDSVSSISRDDMQAYFDRRYSPSNMVLVASGNFNWEDFIVRAEAYCGSWKNFEAPRERPVFNFAPVIKKYNKANIQQAHVLFAVPGPSAQSEDRYAMALLSLMLGDSSGSRLYWELIDSGIAESASADNDERDGVGVFTLYASMAPERLTQVSDSLIACAEQIKSFTADELERARTKLSTRIVMSGELPMGRLMALGSSWNSRKEIHSMKDSLRKLKAVTQDDIHALLDTYPLKNWSQFQLLPE
jgi:predicted Zn-dependent peptidase